MMLSLTLAVCAPFAVVAQEVGAVAARVVVSGHRPAWATAANDLGAVPASLEMSHITMVLKRPAAAEVAFQQLLLDLQNPASPRYHHWLTPAESGKVYGVAPGDLAALSAWLAGQGLRVDDVSPTGIFISFSGPAGVVARALSTEFHYFAQSGSTRSGPRLATTSEPSVSAALAPLIDSFIGLSEAYFQNHMGFETVAIPGSAGTAELRPEYTSGTSHFIAPRDFATIYDINPVYNAGITGSGYRVAVIGGSRVLANDILLFENYSGLAQSLPAIVVLPTGTDPGMTGDGGQAEATLDVDRVIATAPGAMVDLLITGNALSFANTTALLNYEVSTLNDPIVNMSFGACESGSGSYTKSFDAIFAQGAAQGITWVASSGDSGAAGCDVPFAVAPLTAQALSADFICASSYVTCVGGTQFADTAVPSAWWTTTNAPGLSSAVSYIPEGAWNESVLGAGGYVVAGTGGGVSTMIAKPSWQTGVGVPNDGFRDTPDVAFSASNHDGYFGCLTFVGADCSKYIEIFSGTSATAPAMAGVMAMADQKAGARQGNFNPTIYRLAAQTSHNVFHDATIASSGVSGCVVTTPSICNNSDPANLTLTGGLAGYTLTAGYDQATGWGSIDVANLIASLAPGTGVTAGFSIAATPAALTLTAGATASNTSTLTYTSFGSFAGTINQTCTVTYNGASALNYIPTCSFTASTVTLAANGTATGTLTIGSTVPHAAVGGAAALRGYRRSGGGLVAIAGLVLVMLPRRRRVWVALAVVLCFGAGMAGLSGCGGASTSATMTQPVPLVGTTSGPYTVTLTSSSGATVGTAVPTIALTIQ